MPLVSLLLVSKRPRFLPVVLGMVARQTYQRYEIVAMLHGYSVDQLDPPTQRALVAAAVVEEAPPDWSLGRCLNAAVSRARGELVAKIDDDDLYGRGYLEESVAAFEQGAGDIVGKCEVYIYLAGSRRIMLRNPGNSRRPESALAGMTLLFPRRLAERPGFRDTSTGEDRLFIEDCMAMGARPYATSRRHVIARRFPPPHGHTWPADEAHVLRAGILLRSGIVDDSPLGLLRLIGD